MARRSGDDQADMRRYLDEVRAVALLTTAEEAELAARIRAGQEAAAVLDGDGPGPGPEERRRPHEPVPSLLAVGDQLGTGSCGRTCAW